MTLATISAITTATTNTEAFGTNNTAFSLTSTANGQLAVVICNTRSTTVSIASLSGGGVTDWEQVAVYAFAANSPIVAQIFSVFVGRITSFGSAQTVTATGSASLASISGTFAWQLLSTTGMVAGTSWVVEASGSSRNTASSTSITMPTLVPGGANRAYVGYGDPGGTATNTGITAGYTGTIETTVTSGLNQWISNLSVSTSQSPVGKQGSSTSDAVGLLIYATNPAIQSVGTLASSEATANASLSVTTVTAGDVILACATIKTSTITVTGVSGGNATNWQRIAGPTVDATNVWSSEMWMGTVTTSGTQAIAFTYSASVAALTITLDAKQFTAGTGASTTWAVDSASGQVNTTSTTMLYPSLSAAFSGDLYYGYCNTQGSGSAGTSTGFSYAVDASSCVACWNTGVSGTIAPTAPQSPTNRSIGLGALVRPVPAVSPAGILNIGSRAGQNNFKLDTAFAGYVDTVGLLQSDIVEGWNTSPQFTPTADGTGVQMMVNVAAPTIGSSFPRTELRELSNDGVTLIAFDPTSGVHWIRGRTKLTNLTVVKPTVVVAQIHDGATGVGDLLAINTQLSSGKVQLQVRVNGSASNLPHPFLDVAAGFELDWMIYVDTGNWAFYINDLGTPFYTKAQYDALVALGTRTDPFVWSGAAEYYFKAGCYSNTNTASESGDATQFMQIELRYLRHWHTGWTAADAVTLPQPAQFAPFFGG